MTSPGIIPGGGSSLFRSLTETDSQVSKGVFSDYPGATPKYALNRGIRDAEYRESMARLFVEVPAGLQRQFIESLPAETRPLGRVLSAGGANAGGSGTGFVDFLLTRAQENFQEKEQIVDTLTDNYVAFYAGQAPLLFNYSGTVLNTYQDDQRVWLLRIYRDILRGTRLANRNLVARLRYDSFIVSGYLTSLNMSLDGGVDVAGDFQFSLRVKHMTVFTPAMAAPTVVQTPATQNTLLSSYAEVSGETERVATVAPAAPPTTSNVPRGSTLLDVDPRELLATNAANVAFRNTLALDATTWINAENVTRDGQGGVSNILGTNLPETLRNQINQNAVARRTSQRSRGAPTR